MPGISRLTLPENFYDVTSSMLLLQPEPQYLFAALWKRAMAASLAIPTTLGMNGRELVAQGATYASASAGRLAIADNLFDGLFAAKFDMKGQPGHTVRVNRPKYADTTYTKAARKIAAGSSISTVAIAIGSEQNDITIGRYAGPYDQANSRVAPIGVERFDATMGVHNVVQAAGSHLQRDFDKFIDSTMVTLGDTASTVVRPAGMTTDDTPAVVGAAPLDYDTINRAEAAADEANMPVFGDGYRLLVLTPTQTRQLKGDAQYARYAEFHKEYNALFPGYLATVNRMHVFKSTTLSRVNNSNSIAIHRGQLLSPATFMSAMGEAPRVATATDDNYGEAQKMIWLGYLENELADNRFVTSIRTSA